MSNDITQTDYEQTLTKLADMQLRLAAVKTQADLTEAQRAAVVRSCRTIMQQYLRTIKRYEARQSRRRSHGQP